VVCDFLFIVHCNKAIAIDRKDPISSLDASSIQTVRCQIQYHHLEYTVDGWNVDECESFASLENMYKRMLYQV
jgi:hypothetical protein